MNEIIISEILEFYFIYRKKEIREKERKKIARVYVCVCT